MQRITSALTATAKSRRALSNRYVPKTSKGTIDGF